MEAVCVEQNALGNNLLQELAAALKEGDRPVGLAYAVVGFVWFGNWDHLSISPGMMAHCGGRVEEGGKP